MAYYTLANHDPKNRDLAEIFRMMTYEIEAALETMDEDVDGFTIIWDTRNTVRPTTRRTVPPCR